MPTTTTTPMTDGGYVQSYVDTAQTSDGTVQALYAQKFTAAGVALAPPAVMQAPVDSSIDSYNLVALAGGGYATVLQESSSGGPFEFGFVADATGGLINQFQVSSQQATGDKLVAGATGGFLVEWINPAGPPQPQIGLYSTAGNPLSGVIETAGAVTSIAPAPDGTVDVNWADGGTTRTMVLDPRVASTEAAGPGPQFSILDSHGQTVANGGATSDTALTLRVPVVQTGELFAALNGPAFGFGEPGVQVTSADVTRGYVDVPVRASQGAGDYTAEVRLTDANGAATLVSTQGFAENTASAPNGASTGNGEGQMLQAQNGGSVMTGGSGDDILIGASGPDMMTGAGGSDRFTFNVLPSQSGQITDFTPGADKLDFGYLLEKAGYTGTNPVADGYIVLSFDGLGATQVFFEATPATPLPGTLVTVLRGVAPNQIANSDVVNGAATAQDAVQIGFDEVLRQPTPTSADQAFRDSLMSQANAGALNLAQAAADIVQHAAATSSVATLAYQFFTGSVPTSGGMDFLVNPTGPNATNLNSAYYQSFNLENRYINFAVALGSGAGQGAAGFNQAYGTGDIYAAVHQAYKTIFGVDPTDAKVHAIVDTPVTADGATRGQYFADYGGDGLNGVGTKAAMVGWLMAEAVKADVGDYAKSNDAFLTDVALHNAPFGVNLIGAYDQQGFAYTGG